MACVNFYACLRKRKKEGRGLLFAVMMSSGRHLRGQLVTFLQSVSRFPDGAVDGVDTRLPVGSVLVQPQLGETLTQVLYSDTNTTSFTLLSLSLSLEHFFFPSVHSFI